MSKQLDEVHDVIDKLIPNVDKDRMHKQNSTRTLKSIPDPSFRAQLKSEIPEAFYTTKDGIDLLDVDNELVIYKTSLEVPLCGIKSLDGIQYFTNIRFLDCSYNRLSILDLRELCNLGTLMCNENEIGTLYLPNNTYFYSIQCNKNCISHLDVSAYPRLQILSCNMNCLTELDVSKNDELEHLSLAYNKVGKLDVTELPNLNNLNISHNEIKSIDLTNNKKLEVLYAKCNKLYELDISNNTKLQHLGLCYNDITELNTKGLNDLKYLSCRFNQLKTLDVLNNDTLKILDCDWNSIEKDKLLVSYKIKLGAFNQFPLNEMTNTMRQELERYLSDNKNKPVIMDMVGRLLIEEHKKYDNIIQSLHQRVKTLEKREQDQLNEEDNETAKIRCR